VILKFPKNISNKINFLIGSKNFISKNFETFNNLSIEFLSDVSQEIFKDKSLLIYPDIISFAFWSRKKALEAEKQVLKINNCFGRGLTFHIAPSNVALNFIYSFSFSLLAGNSNIVRLPSKRFKEIDLIFKIFKKLKIKKYKKIFESNIFIRYEANDLVNSYFSSISNTRMIWGGDNTINKFRKYPTNPFCVDFTFPDRYSLCIINSLALKKLNDFNYNNLVKNFFNDTYLYDQMACNSPHLIMWQNPDDKQIDRFWLKIKKYLKKKYTLDHFMAVNKLTKLQTEKVENKNNNINEIKNFKNILILIDLNKIEKNFTNKKGQYGYFYQVKNISLKKFFLKSNPKIQTITYFGLDKNEINQQIKKCLPSGIDRVVPIGQSSRIKFVWDGFNMINSLSRKIEIY
jgi:hypothetical protein